jgi:hypothetical protein
VVAFPYLHGDPAELGGGEPFRRRQHVSFERGQHLDREVLGEVEHSAGVRPTDRALRQRFLDQGKMPDHRSGLGLDELDHRSGLGSTSSTTGRGAVQEAAS